MAATVEVDHNTHATTNRDEIAPALLALSSAVDEVTGVVWTVPQSPKSHRGKEADILQREFVATATGLIEERTTHWRIRETQLTGDGSPIPVGSEYLVEEKKPVGDVRLRTEVTAVVPYNRTGLIEPSAVYGKYYQNGHPEEEIAEKPQPNAPESYAGVNDLTIGLRRLARAGDVGVEASTSMCKSDVVYTAHEKEEQGADMIDAMRSTGSGSWSHYLAVLHRRNYNGPDSSEPLPFGNRLIASISKESKARAEQKARSARSVVAIRPKAPVALKKA